MSKKLSKLISKLSIFLFTLLTIGSIAHTAYGLSGKLYEFDPNSWCSGGGIYTQSSFFNDDGAFYVYMNVDFQYDSSNGKMEVGAYKKGLLGYSKVTSATLTGDGGRIITYTVANGEYKLKFATTYPEYETGYFSGGVYDDK